MCINNIGCIFNLISAFFIQAKDTVMMPVTIHNIGLSGSSLKFQTCRYWYNYGCLFPNMMTVFIAVDKCTRSNSCLQVIPFSFGFEADQCMKGGVTLVASYYLC
jgi:hypothetical protein